MDSIANVRRILGQLRSEYVGQTRDRPLNMAQTVEGTDMCLSEWAFDFVYRGHKKRQMKAFRAEKPRSA